MSDMFRNSEEDGWLGVSEGRAVGHKVREGRADSNITRTLWVIIGNFTFPRFSLAFHGLVRRTQDLIPYNFPFMNCGTFNFS